MDKSLSGLRIDDQRFRSNFEALAEIGATADGGAHRPALSRAHLEARSWFLAQAERLGLDARIDGAGNHSAVLPCGPSGGPTLLLGSHLDSVPRGGRFDGALGVVAALEVLLVVRDRDLSLSTNLEAIDFTDEEGHYANFLGSLALTGKLKPEHLERPRGGRERLLSALGHAGLSESSLLGAARKPASLAGYLELHIEQGRRLADATLDVGIVTGIVGIRSFKIRFLGRADHAGTTPMAQRLDAAQGASAFALAVREVVMKEHPAGVATVGNMEFVPGVFNVVPQEVTLALEFRADDDRKLDHMEAALLREASVSARGFGLELEIEPVDRTPPASMDDGIQEAFAEACETLGLRYSRVASGAGHDAQCLAEVCPTGMMFVPSVGGFSHSSKEFTEWEDCINGANALLQATLLLAR